MGITGKSGGWKKEFTPELLQEVWERSGDLLQKLNYEELQ